MSLRSKLRRLSDVTPIVKTQGLSAAIKAGVNRYKYDHFTSVALPIVSITTPYHLQIEPSRVCNLRCRMCEYSVSPDRGTILALEDFKTILGRFPAVSSLDLTGIGECFCNPRFLEILRCAKARGLNVIFSTNGNLLTEERMDALIEMGIDTVSFSIDAATKGTHEKIRINSDFDRVLHAIRTLSDKVTAAGTGKPRRRMSYILSQENIGEAHRFVALAKSVGVTDISFRNLIVFEGGGYNASDSVKAYSLPELSSLRERICEEAERHAVQADLQVSLDQEQSVQRICRYPWMTAYVDAFGNMYPCCMVTQRNNDTTQYAMGNLLTERFEDIWNRTAYQELRAGIVHPTEVPPLCRGCPMLSK